MNNKKVSIHVSDSFSFGYNMYITYIDPITNKMSVPVISEDTMKEISPVSISEPTLVLHKDEVQNLMDNLWRAGIRPSNGEGGNAQVDAIKYHLEDMRKLVFRGDYDE